MANAPRDLLDDIFQTPEKDVKTFREAIDDTMIEGLFPGAAKNVARKIISGEPDKLSAPKNLKMELSGFVRIYSGWHNDDYAWHIEPAAIRRPWKVSEDRVVYAIAKTMNGTIPKRIEVKIWYPPRDWEIRTFTFKAMGLKNEWSIQQQELDAVTLQLFEVLNPLV